MEAPLGALEVWQPVLPQVPRRGARREVILHQFLDDARQEHLAAVPGRE